MSRVGDHGMLSHFNSNHSSQYQWRFTHVKFQNWQILKSHNRRNTKNAHFPLEMRMSWISYKWQLRTNMGKMHYLVTVCYTKKNHIINFWINIWYRNVCMVHLGSLPNLCRIRFLVLATNLCQGATWEPKAGTLNKT